MIDLTGATAPISLDWEQDVDIDDGRLPSEPDYFLRVAIRDLAGGLLATAFEAVNTSAGDGIKSFDISAYTGMTVRVCFEQRSSDDSDGSAIDDVSVTDFTATEFITNGDFETGDFTGWELAEPLEPGHMKSGMRTVEGLEVVRWFHTRPNAKWGRWVDSLHNPTGAPIVKTVTYLTDLGSDGSGIIYVTDLTGGRAISEWDGDDSDRDIGWVHGSADLVTFTTDTCLACGFGSDEMEVEFDIVVAPGATVRIVQFIVMNGVQTHGIDEFVLATDIDAVNQWIVANWGFAPILTDGMTAAEIASVVNW